MENLEILDCTLRDGGYVNNWLFGYKNIKKIIQNLINAKIDYIECGFLENAKHSKEKSLFSDIKPLYNITNKDSDNTKLLLMINFGSYPIEKIPYCENENFLLRIAFKKEDVKTAISYCKKLIDKGYKIFINPMHTNFYTEKEIIELINQVNKISPYAFTIVDTTGAMKEKDAISLFNLVDKILNKNIKKPDNRFYSFRYGKRRW